MPHNKNEVSVLCTSVSVWVVSQTRLHPLKLFIAPSPKLNKPYCQRFELHRTESSCRPIKKSIRVLCAQAEAVIDQSPLALTIRVRLNSVARELSSGAP